MEIKAHFRNMRMEVELENGSVIQFGGSDTSEECDKYRGLGLDWVGVDECKSYPLALLRELLLEILEPALADRDGTLVLIGTPGPVLAGPFYAVTTGDLTVIPEEERAFWSSRHWNERKTRRAKWSYHTWTAADNVAKPGIWRRFVQMKEDSGLSDSDPVWVREYLGQWVPDADALVYSYSRLTDGRCDWEKDPDGPHGLPIDHHWRYVLGLDLGWHDATAFVVAAWSETHPALHIVHVEKHSYMDIKDVAERTRSLEKTYGTFQVRVADKGGLGKQLVESLASVYGLPFETAQKTDKVDFIKLLNSDLQEGKIKLDPSSELADEWRNIQWAGADRKKIDPGCVDHAADAALYLWRYAYHHFWKEREQAPIKGSESWWAKLMREEEMRACEQERDKQHGHFLDAFKSNLDKLPWQT